jgi:hypothetical protein
MRIEIARPFPAIPNDGKEFRALPRKENPQSRCLSFRNRELRSIIGAELIRAQAPHVRSMESA